MEKAMEYIIWLTDSEFKGKSFNGPSLIKTLKTLSAGQVAATDTFEKYSAWGIVLHVMYWKYYLAEKLGADVQNLYPYQQDNWPALPEALTEESWQETLDNLVKVHAAYINILKLFPSDELPLQFKQWKCSWGEAIYWMATHDTFHGAQIRSMGLKNFKQSQK